MPILIAMTQAMAGGDFRRTLGSTHAWTPYLWLNGPVARQLGISSGQGEINDEANTALSRFLSLALQNLAGYYVGQNRMGTFGYLQPWCLVEDETACNRIGWQTWNEQQGYDTQAKTMTTIPTMQKGATAFLVTGDASRNKVQTMPGGGFSTVRIDLPAAWDSLMAAKGYPRLTDMCIISK